MTVTSKLHHYVPRLLLRRFSTDPGAENPVLHVLDMSSGRATRNSVRNVAAISHYYTVKGQPSIPRDYIEKLLAQVEARAKDPIEKLTSQRVLSMEEQIDVATFVYVQHHRAPRTRTWATSTMEHSARHSSADRALDLEAVQRFFARRGETLSREEAAEWGRYASQEMKSGRVGVTLSHASEVLMMFIVANEVIPRLVSDFTWATVKAHRPSFALPDHPVSVLDPSVGPDRGVSWFSSQHVQVTMPVDPSTVLMLWPGPFDQGSIQADEETVLDLNLRSYGSAE
jgi:Protein of unknown function (DUF4238)